MTDPAEERVRDHLARLGVAHEIVPCDPALADTAAFCAAYGYAPDESANTILVVGKSDPPRDVACVVLATTRLDVNRAVRTRLGVKKASFANPEQTRDITGMLIGGVTALGLPEDLPIWVDSRVAERPRIVLGGGSRSCKVVGPPELLTAQRAVEVVTDLAIPVVRTERSAGGERLAIMPSAAQVGALGADGGRHHADPHQQGEDLATQAEGQRRFERRRDHDQGDEHDRHDSGAERPRHQRADRQRRPDALGEALRRSGHQLRLDGQAGHDEAGHEDRERADVWTEQHPQREPARERDEEHRPAGDQERHTLDDDARGHQPSGHLVHRVGEPKGVAPGHAPKAKAQILIRQLRIRPGATAGTAGSVPPAMALTLTVDRARWRAHLLRTVAAYTGVVPVVKGNGYGFGRTYLAELATAWTTAGSGVDELAVGTVHELAGLPLGGPRPLVLTPALARELTPGVGPAVLTVGSERHVAEIVASGPRPPVIVKLATSMARYGASPSERPRVVAALEAAGLVVHGYSIHPPLAGTSAEHAAEVEAWTSEIPDGSAVYVSHLDAPAYAELTGAHPGLRWRIRLGTALWHGDKSFFHLAADVVEVRRAAAGSCAGYRLADIPGDGSIVMVTAGTAHGVRPLADGSSPFHFARRRLALLEPPHMHTAMLFVPDGDPTPQVGDQVDVQHPLTMTLVDRIIER